MMWHKSCFVFLLLVTLGLTAQVQVYKELQSAVASSDLQGWVVKHPSGTVSQRSCPTFRMFGGPSQFGKLTSMSRVFADLPPHYQVTLQVTLYKFDNWNNQNFFVIADGQYVYNQAQTAAGNQVICSPLTNSGGVVPLTLTFDHNSANLNVFFGSTLGDSGSWAVSDVILSVQPCPTGCVTCESADASVCTGYVLVESDWMGPTVNQEGWTVTNGVSKTTQCGAVQMFGGYNSFGMGTVVSKTISNLPAHTDLLIKLQFWAIDSWDKEPATLSIDGKVVWTGNPSYPTSWPNYLCDDGSAAGWPDRAFDVSIKATHSASTATFSITTGLNQPLWDESFGLRAFQVFARSGGVTEVLVSSDLMSKTFTSTEGWTPTWNEVPNVITNCGGYQLLGGFGVFGQYSAVSKTFYDLPPHYGLRVQFYTVKIDSWDGENLLLYIDGVVATQKSFMWHQGAQLCGQQNGGWNENVEKIEAKTAHALNSVSITITSTLNQNAADESWGIREFQLWVLTCPAGCVSCDPLNFNTCGTWQLADQQFQSSGGFNLQAFQVSGAVASQYNCAGATMFGGWNNFGQGAAISRTISNLPTHKYVRLQLQFWKIDSWDGETAKLTVDGKQAWAQSFQGTATGIANSICGIPGAYYVGWVEQPVNIDVTFAHTAATLTVAITTTVDQGAADESWGIRNFKVFLDSADIMSDDDVNVVDGMWIYTAFAWNLFSTNEGWAVVKPYSSPYIQNCGLTKVFGGYNILGSGSSLVKSVALPPHYKMKIKLKFFKIDSWDDEFFRIYVDGMKVFERSYALTQGAQICGVGNGAWNEVVDIIEVEFPHNNINAVVVLTSTLNQGAADEAWAVKNIRISVTECPDGCETCTEGTLSVCKKWQLAGTFFNQSVVDPQGWTVGGSAAKTTNCSGIILVGGDGVFGRGATLSKTFTNLVGHNLLRVRAQVWKLGSWNNELFRVFADNNMIYTAQFNNTVGVTNDICGGNGPQQFILDIDITFDHTNSNLNLVFGSTLAGDATQQSWGIRDIQVLTADIPNLDDAGANDPNIYYKAFQGNTFVDTDGWNVVQPYSQPVFGSCGNTRLLGGYNILGAGSALVKQISVPPHQDITMRFEFFKIDSWDNEVFFVYVDGTPVYNSSFAYNFGTFVCGVGGWHDSLIAVNIKVPHVNPTVSIVMTTTLNQGAADESWGIRNFQFFYTACPNGCAICTQDPKFNEQCSSAKLIAQEFSKPQVSAPGWTTVNAPVGFTNCSGIELFGGYQIFGAGSSASKTFDTSPIHNKLAIRFQAWFIDSWDGEYLQLYVDNQLIWKATYNFQSGRGFVSNVCGRTISSWKEHAQDVEVLIDHVNPTATLKFTSTLNQAANDESWGIRDLQIFYDEVYTQAQIQNVTKDNLVYSAFTTNNFTDLTGWTIVAPADPKTLFSSCNGIRLLGGYGVMGQGSAAVLYRDLQPHYSVTIRMTVYKIDSWDGEKFLVYVDGKVMAESSFSYSQGTGQCGNANYNWNDDVLIFNIKDIPHNGPNINVVITSTLDQSAFDESWGIRDFYLYTQNCPASCAACSANTLTTCQNNVLISKSWNTNVPSAADGWAISGNAVANQTNTVCAGINLLGGFGLFGRGSSLAKNFQDLPVHNKLGIRLQFWKMDTWDGEQFQIYVDGNIVWAKAYGGQGSPTNLCGLTSAGANEFIEDIWVSIDHASDAANIVITTSLDQGATDESWGVRNFQLWYPQLPSNPLPPVAQYAAFYSNSFDDTDGWFATGYLSPQLFTACSGVRIFGGFGVFGQGASITKILTLPPHYQIDVSFNFFKIDSWDQESVLVYIDGVQVFKQAFGITRNTQRCGVYGLDWGEEMIAVSFSIQHNSPTVTIVITSNLNQNAKDESWGLRDFILNIKGCPSPCTVCSALAQTKEACSQWNLVDVSLDETTNSTFNTTGWVVYQDRVPQPPNKSFTYLCAGVPVLGAYGNFGKGAATSRLVQGLPLHNAIRVKMQLWKLDSWDGESLIVAADGQIVWRKNLYYTDGFSNSICGAQVNGWIETTHDIDINFGHVSSSINITITSTLDQGALDESWGVRDVQVFTLQYNESRSLVDPNPPYYYAFMTNSFGEIDNWVTSGVTTSQVITACGNNRIYGGYGVFGAGAATTRLLTDLPPHSQISIAFTLYRIDKWDNARFLIYVDGVQSFTSVTPTTLGTQICGTEGSQYNEQVQEINITVPHNSSSVVIILTSTLGAAATTSSWGIKYFRVWYTPCPVGCVVCGVNDKTNATCSQWSLVGESLVYNNYTTNDTDGWKANVQPARIYNCSGIQLFGATYGNNNGAQRVFNDLPLHNTLRLKMQLWKVDNFKGEKIQVYVDDSLIWQRSINSLQTPYSICGLGSRYNEEEIYDLDVKVDHASPSVNIVIRTTTPVGESHPIGIRDVQVFAESVQESVGNSSAYYSAFTTQTFSTTDGWVVNQPYQTNYYTSCNGVRLFGGHGVFGGKSSIVKYLTVPPHYELTISFTLYKIDSWNNELFLLFVDGKQVYNQQFYLSQGTQACGKVGTWNEVIVQVKATVQHNSPSVVIALSSTLDQDASNESWGIRDFALTFSGCPSGCLTCTKNNLNTCNTWTLGSSSWTGLTGLTNDGWTLTGGKSGVTTCSGIPIVGGYGLFGKDATITKQFALPAHNRVYLQVQFWKVDKWNNERASIYVDGVEVWGQNFNQNGNYQAYSVNLCGNTQTGWTEQVIDVGVAFDHINTNPIVKITSTIGSDPTISSWGVRNFNMYIQVVNPLGDTQPSNTSFSSSFFGSTFTDPQGWLIIQRYPGMPAANNQNPITTCGGTRLFGGYNILGGGAVVTKQYALPPHKEITISLKFFKIDVQNDVQYLFYVDGQSINAQPINPQTVNMCGSTGIDYVANYQFTVPHNNPTVTFMITSTLANTPNIKSWGFRDFEISITQCDPGCLTCSVNDKASCSQWKPLFSSWTSTSAISTEGWKLQGVNQVSSTVCGATTIFGGFNQLGQNMVIGKTLFALPSHTKVQIKFQVWKIDSWDGERLSLYVDGSEAWGHNFVASESIQRDVCGHSGVQWVDDVMNVEVTVPHNQYTMVVNFKNTLNQQPADESYGLRDFQIFTDSIPESDDPNRPVYQAFTNATAVNGTDDWIFENVKGNVAPPVSSCGKEKLIGGYNLFGTGARAIKKLNLEPHYEITVQFVLYKIDSWYNEQFLFYIDGQEAYSQFFSIADGSQICGSGANSWNEARELVSVTFPHNSPQVQFLLTSTLNNDAGSESWGFRNFIVTTKKCPAGCVVCDNNIPNQCAMWSFFEADWTTQNFGSDGWNVTNGVSAESTCAGSRLFGGAFATGTFIQKTFTNIPAHSKIRIQAQFWKIDSWDDERAGLFADTREIWGQQYFILGNTGFVRDLCGNPGWRDDITDIDVTFVHTSQNLTLDFRTTLDQGAGDESWGVRRLYVYVGKCAEGCLDCHGSLQTDCIATDDVDVVYSAFQSNFTNADFSGWYFNGLSTQTPSTTCGDKWVGGFNYFGQGVSAVRVISLGPHYLVRVKFNLVKIDSWDNEAFVLYVDGKQVYFRRFTYSSGSQICGQGHAAWNEEIVTVDVTVKHSAPSAVVVLSSTLDQGAADEAWGFNNFQLLTQSCPTGCLVCNTDDPTVCTKWRSVEQDWNDNQVQTLEGWTTTSAYANTNNQCAGVNLVGGPGVFGGGSSIQKTISLGTHDMLRISLQFWKIDNWGGQFAYILVDGEMVWANYYSYWNGYKVPLCGNLDGWWNEQTEDVHVEIQHTNPSATIKVMTTLPTGASTASWGVRGFSTFQASCGPYCGNCTSAASGGCLQCKGDFALQDGNCVMPANQLVIAKSFFEKSFTDLAGWVLTNTQGTATTYTCSQTTVVGGHGVLGAKASATRTYTLGSHRSLRFKAQLWKLDSWDGEELFVQIDGTVVWTKHINSNTVNGLPKCGTTDYWWQEATFDVDVTIPHTSGNATIVISSTLDQAATDESFGFREVAVYVQTTEQCAQFFSECNYQGQMVEFCKESRNVLKTNFLKQIKSFKIPPYGHVNVFEDDTFNKQVVELTQSNSCVDDNQTLTLINGGKRMLFVHHGEQEGNLRKAKL